MAARFRVIMNQSSLQYPPAGRAGTSRRRACHDRNAGALLNQGVKQFLNEGCLYYRYVKEAHLENTFLPVSRKDMEERGQTQLDFVFISGDAYVDHPSFGPAILCRPSSSPPEIWIPWSITIRSQKKDVTRTPFHRAVKWENAPTALSSSTEI